MGSISKGFRFFFCKQPSSGEETQKGSLNTISDNWFFSASVQIHSADPGGWLMRSVFRWLNRSGTGYFSNPLFLRIEPNDFIITMSDLSCFGEGFFLLSSFPLSLFLTTQAQVGLDVERSLVCWWKVETLFFWTLLEKSGHVSTRIRCRLWSYLIGVNCLCDPFAGLCYEFWVGPTCWHCSNWSGSIRWWQIRRIGWYWDNPKEVLME